MSVNAREERFESVELFDKPALLTNSRINRDTVPQGFYCYDLRGSDYDPGKPVTVENSVMVNHAATVLTAEPIKFQKDKDFRRISGKLNFLGEHLDLVTFCEQNSLSLQPDNQKFQLRPASPDEVG
ncbi:MAG: LPD28 domain-containing protein, partial [Oscillospiraceae bacterium]